MPLGLLVALGLGWGGTDVILTFYSLWWSGGQLAILGACDLSSGVGRGGTGAVGVPDVL